MLTPGATVALQRDRSLLSIASWSIWSASPPGAERPRVLRKGLHDLERPRAVGQGRCGARQRKGRHEGGLSGSGEAPKDRRQVGPDQVRSSGPITDIFLPTLSKNP